MLFPHCTDVIPHCTEGIPPLYWIPSTVLNTLHSTDVIPHCTDVIPLHVLMLPPKCTEYPPQYWSYPPLYWCYPPACTDVIPPLYWTTSTILKVSPTVLKLSPTCTAVIPPQYWRYPSTVLNTLHSTDVIPHSTDVIPRMYWCYPPLYWTTSTVLKLSPTVLNNLHSTEAIPTVLLNSLQCTEQPPQYWTDVIWGKKAMNNSRKNFWAKSFGLNFRTLPFSLNMKTLLIISSQWHVRRRSYALYCPRFFHTGSMQYFWKHWRKANFLFKQKLFTQRNMHQVLQDCSCHVNCQDENFGIVQGHLSQIIYSFWSVLAILLESWRTSFVLRG